MAVELSAIAEAARPGAGKPPQGYQSAYRWQPGDARGSFPSPSQFAVNPWSGSLFWPWFPEAVWSKYKLYDGYVPQDIWATRYTEIVQEALTQARKLNFKLAFVYGSAMDTARLLRQLGQPDRYVNETNEQRAARAALSFATLYLRRIEEDAETQALYWRLARGLHPGEVLAATADASGTRAVSREAVDSFQRALLDRVGGKEGIVLALAPWMGELAPDALDALLTQLATIPNDIAASVTDAGPPGSPWYEVPFDIASIEAYLPVWPWERNAYGEPALPIKAKPVDGGMGNLIRDISGALKSAAKSVSRAASATFSDPLGAPQRIVEEARRSTGKALSGAGNGLLKLDAALGGGIAGSAVMQAVIYLAGGVIAAAFPVADPLTMFGYLLPGTTANLLREAGEYVETGDTEFDNAALLDSLKADGTLLALEASLVATTAGAVGAAGGYVGTAGQLAALGKGAALTGTAIAIAGGAVKGADAQQAANENDKRKRTVSDDAQREEDKKASSLGGVVKVAVIGGAAWLLARAIARKTRRSK